MLPLIRDFMENTNKHSEVQEIVDKWSKENNSLAAAIQKEFKKRE